METVGDMLNPEDKERLEKWREEHLHSFAGFQEDPDLPPNGYRTAGDVLFISPDYFKCCFGDRRPNPDEPFSGD